MTVKKNILLIVIFIFAVLTLFINKLTSPRVLSTNELLILVLQSVQMNAQRQCIKYQNL